MKEYQLDIGIGGFSSTTPWKKHVGLTRPYATETIKAGAPKKEDIPEEIEDYKLVVEKGSNGLVAVRKKKGIPVVVDSIGSITSLTAAPQSELLEKGAAVSEYDLDKIRYVLVVPKGENGLLKNLEDYIYSEWKKKKIKKSL